MDAAGVCVLFLVSALDFCDVRWQCHIASRPEYVSERHEHFRA